MSEGQGWAIIILLMLIAGFLFLVLLELDSLETVLRLMDIAVE